MGSRVILLVLLFPIQILLSEFVLISLGISIAIDLSGEEEMQVKVKEIVPAAENKIDTRVIIVEKGRVSGKTCLVLAADETAAVHLQLWGDECDAFEPGDILSLTNGIFSFIPNVGLLLRAGKRGKLEKIGEFTMLFVESPNISEIQWNPHPSHPNRYTPHAVVSLFSRIFPPLH